MLLSETDIGHSSEEMAALDEKRNHFTGNYNLISGILYGGRSRLSLTFTY